MTTVHTDFLGPFIECNGWIHRPMANTPLARAASVRAQPVPFSPQCQVSDGQGSDELWPACGSVDAYHEARYQLTATAFEHFASMACGRALAPHLPPAIPRLRQLFPSGRVDVTDAAYMAYVRKTKALEYVTYARMRDVERPSVQRPAGPRFLQSIGGGRRLAADADTATMEWAN